VKSGILLSGGLDSTAILAIHRQSFQEVPDTFTVAFAAPRQYARTHEYTETMQAREIAQRYGSTHSSACYSAQEVLDQLPNIVASLDEPIADPTAIPLWFAVRMARQSGVKVLHSGEGLDELFNGYQVYQQSHWLNALARVPEGIRRMVFSVLSRFELSGRGLLARSLAPVSEWYQGVGSVFSAEEQEKLFQGHILNDLRSSSRPQEYVRDMIFPARDASTLTQMTYFDLLAWLPENTLVKSDKISMAHSVELRVPFLHEGVVDFAMEMDDSDKLRRGVGKWIVREALREVVTPDVLRRPKVGFPIPLTAWMFGEWKDFVLSNLMDANAHTCGMYKRDYVEGLFLVPDKERRRAARQLWTLLSLELWYQYVYTDRSIGKALKTVVCG
jgi:asparagine synthase (glutamine-hydrolysing)